MSEITVQTLSKHLTWSHYCKILSIEDKSKRDFYEKEFSNAKWSVRKLKYTFLLVPFLISCSSANKAVSESENSIIIPHDYSEVSDRMIEWQDIFEQEDDFYYCYVFSKTCSHCNAIKDYVIDYALRKNNMYFIEFNKNIPIMSDISYTIEKTNVEDIGILGTPTLLEIFNGTLIANVAGEKNILQKLQFSVQNSLIFVNY